jgi:hypothetical protein
MTRRSVGLGHSGRCSPDFPVDTNEKKVVAESDQSRAD